MFLIRRIPIKTGMPMKEKIPMYNNRSIMVNSSHVMMGGAPSL
jgi:hypothetical protein